MKMTQCLSIDLNQQERQKSQERPMDIWKLLGDGNGIPNQKKKKKKLFCNWYQDMLFTIWKKKKDCYIIS